MNISSSMLGKKYEEVYYKIFRITANMLAISRMKDGIFMQVNDAFMTILGYSRDELIGKSSLEIGLFVNAQDRV
ncbi:MAG: PAS domain S-box protein, partial [Kiritimatiellia bacterium]